MGRENAAVDTTVEQHILARVAFVCNHGAAKAAENPLVSRLVQVQPRHLDRCSLVTWDESTRDVCVMSRCKNDMKLFIR